LCDPEETGLIACWDPVTYSYPAFVITDDLGYLVDGWECPCGKTGQEIVYVGRAPDAEVRSCRLKLAGMTEVIETKEASVEYEKMGEKAHFAEISEECFTE
jgi:long-chain-fatty-acid---luciferin-component ligase